MKRVFQSKDRERVGIDLGAVETVMEEGDVTALVTGSDIYRVLAPFDEVVHDWMVEDGD